MTKQTPISETQSIKNLEGSPTIKVVSSLPLEDWRGSITIFNGFTRTFPDDELKNVPWEVIRNKVCPERPLVITNKQKGQYFISSLLKREPLVGNTLKHAEQSGKPTINKMRSKCHVTTSRFLVFDIDGLPEESLAEIRLKLEQDGLSYLIFSSHSYGNPKKPGLRARLTIPVDSDLNIEDYSAAWHAFDHIYLNGMAGKADSSSAHLYQQQGIWMTHPDWKVQAFKHSFEGGVASASALIELGQSLMPTSPTKSHEISGVKTDNYPPSSADKVADGCKQIRLFRDNKGAGQSEPSWNNCLGVVGHCENGPEHCQNWSSGYQGYSYDETEKKLARRLQYAPTTCEQFKKTCPENCSGCQQTCKSPITLGWLKNQKDQTKEEKRAKESASSFFEEVEPWPDVVILGDLLKALIGQVKQHIVVTNEQALAVALWIIMTWVTDYVEILPLLIINAPERACGKSQLLDVVGLTTARSISVSNISQASMFRIIDKCQPTLLIDEADTFIRDKPELMGLINAGHSRNSAYVIRSVGDAHEPKKFPVWGAKALAGIALDRQLKDATLSRGIVINMRRKLPGEKVNRLRHANKQMFAEIKRKCARFASDYGQKIAEARPELPEALNDRQQDNWEILLAIAACAGSNWLEQATQAALALSVSNESISTSVELLMAIREIFARKNVVKLTTNELISVLCDDEEGPWASYNRGKEITARQLGSELGKFQIKSRTTKFQGKSLKGYFLEDFTDAFARYLPSLDTPADLPRPRNFSPEAMPDMGSEVTDEMEHIRNGYSNASQNVEDTAINTLRPSQSQLSPGDSAEPTNTKQPVDLLDDDDGIY